MKTLNSLLAPVLGTTLLAAIALNSQAQSPQETLQLKMKISTVTTNENGGFVKATLTDKSISKDCISELGLTNKPPLVLAYTVGGDLNGDIIEVVNSATGERLCQKLRLLFPLTLSNGSGTEVQQLVYVFSDQQSENVGCGLVTRRTLKNNRTAITGTLNFYVLPEGTNGLMICKATFNTTKPLSTNP